MAARAAENAKQAKIFYSKLTPAEKKNIDIMLKNVGESLDNISDTHLYEIERLANKRPYKSTGLTSGDYGNSNIGATIKDTRQRWSGGTPTKDW